MVQSALDEAGDHVDIGNVVWVEHNPIGSRQVEPIGLPTLRAGDGPPMDAPITHASHPLASQRRTRRRGATGRCLQEYR